MARHASTYRQARRAAWKLSELSWPQFNGERMLNSGIDGKKFGPARGGRAVTHLDGSKYMPHIGAKQRSKGAAA